MKKLFSLVALMAAFALTACGGNNSAPASSKAGSSQAAPTSAEASNEAQQTEEGGEHVHEWVAGDKAGLFTAETCACGKKGYRLDVNDAEGWNKGDTKMNGKSAPDNQSSWAATGLPAGDYEVEFSCKMSWSSHSSRYWYNMAKHGNETAASSPDTEDESDYRYWIEIDGVAAYPTNEQSWGDCGLSADDFNSCVVISKVTVAATANQISLVHGNIGYSLIIESVRFVK